MWCAGPLKHLLNLEPSENRAPFTGPVASVREAPLVGQTSFSSDEQSVELCVERGCTVTQPDAAWVHA